MKPELAIIQRARVAGVANHCQGVCLFLFIYTARNMQPCFTRLVGMFACMAWIGVDCTRRVWIISSDLKFPQFREARFLSTSGIPKRNSFWDAFGFVSFGSDRIVFLRSREDTFKEARGRVASNAGGLRRNAPTSHQQLLIALRNAFRLQGSGRS